MSPADFQCPYAPHGAARCPDAICDCFIDQHPSDPFGLHPEAFVVGVAVTDHLPDNTCHPECEPQCPSN